MRAMIRPTFILRESKSILYEVPTHVPMLLYLSVQNYSSRTLLSVRNSNPK